MSKRCCIDVEGRGGCYGYYCGLMNVLLTYKEGKMVNKWLITIYPADNYEGGREVNLMKAVKKHYIVRKTIILSISSPFTFHCLPSLLASPTAAPSVPQTQYPVPTSQYTSPLPSYHFPLSSSHPTSQFPVSTSQLVQSSSVSVCVNQPVCCFCLNAVI